MEIHLIWAQEHDGGIGKNGQLPWHVPEDLKNFKKITLNSTIVMGRKTWDSLPFKPLPKRKNIIFTKKIIDGVETYDNINNYIRILNQDPKSKIFVIGGSSIYKIFYNYATHLHITFIDMKSDGIDTFFPIKNEQIEEKFEKIYKKNMGERAIYTYWTKNEHKL